MIKLFKYALLLCLLQANLLLRAQVSILPQKAAAGDTVTISFDPGKSAATHKEGPFFVDFNYSNFYEFPPTFPALRSPTKTRNLYSRQAIAVSMRSTSISRGN